MMAWATFCRATSMGSLAPGLSRSERVSRKTLSPTSRTVNPGTTCVCSTDPRLTLWSTGGAAGFGGAPGCGLRISTARSSQGSLFAPLCCQDAWSAINCLYWGRERMICYGDCERRRDRLHLEDLLVA